MSGGSMPQPQEAAQAEKVRLLEVERQHRRSTRVLRTAKLMTGSGETLCLVRSIAAKGFSAQSALRLDQGDRLSILLGDIAAPCTIVRTDGDCFDADFDEPVPVQQWLDTAEGGARRSAPRVRVRSRARLMLGRQSAFVMLCDLSSDGAQIETDELLFEGDVVALRLRDWPVPIRGSVCWTDATRAGIAFDQPLRLDDLMQWLGQSGSGAALDADEIRQMVRQ